MQTSPFFASQPPRTPFPVPSLVGGPSLAAAAQAAHAVLPRGAVPQPAATAPVFKVPKLNTALYHRTVFTMPLHGKRGNAEITVYFDKATLEEPYICNWQAMAVLCDEDGHVLQNALGTFLSRNDQFKKVSFNLYFKAL